MCSDLAIANNWSASVQNLAVGGVTAPSGRIPGEAFSPLQVIQTRVAFTWARRRARNWLRHQAGSNFPPKSFQFSQGVLAPLTHIRWPLALNSVPATEIL